MNNVFVCNRVPLRLTRNNYTVIYVRTVAQSLRLVLMRYLCTSIADFIIHIVHSYLKRLKHIGLDYLDQREVTL